MRRWSFIFVILTVTAFYVFQQWFSLTVQWDGMVPHLSEAPARQTSSPFARLLGWWGGQNVGGLKLKLPFEVQAVPPPNGISGRWVRSVYKGWSENHGIYVAHLVKLPESPPLEWSSFTFFNDDIGMRVASINAVTAVHGMRAQRRDRVSISNTLQRLRARDLLLQQGDDIWIINYYAPENDSDAEDVYAKIVNSAKPIAPSGS
ncbi:MAG TPA: hypothetical protein VGM54_20595 [Chthoniobacter sp.]